MIDVALDQKHQLIITARLAEFCRFREYRLKDESDPWVVMRRKLEQIEAPLSQLKGELFAASKKALCDELRAGKVAEARLSDYKALFERLLSRGDFADLAFALMTAAPGPAGAQALSEAVKEMQPIHLFIEERLPAERRSPSWEALVKELTSRLDIPRLDRIMTRGLAEGELSDRRKRTVLRRLRVNTAEYCTVVRIPTTADDTFSPFMLSRVEALVAANLRLLGKYR